ncbi:MAG: hypothetical protein RR568_08695 [Anaerorhabdus sp.]|uniref:hypothetical protein n=1 Tax=Anaerorhabdus sp. TaxID=1872524 RepID=UPI002FCA3DC3
MQKDKLNKTKLHLCIGIGLVILVISAFFIVQLNNKPAKPNDQLINDITMADGSQSKPEEKADGAYQIDLMDSVVFNLKDIDFKFVIAKIRVQSDEAINLKLSHFTTSEGIALDQVDTYVKALEDKSLFLGKQNVWFEILSNEPSTMVNIFIPVKDKNAKEIILKNDLGTEDIKINLSNSKGTAEMLQYKADDIITDGRSYQMTVSSAYPITGDTMTQNGQEYLLPSTVEVYSFNIEAVSLWGDKIVIEEAQYIPNDSKETFVALDSSIQSMKYSNIIGKEINEKDTGDLFFVAYSPVESPVTYKGVLKLKVQGQDSWITINVDLN